MPFFGTTFKSLSKPMCFAGWLTRCSSPIVSSLLCFLFLASISSFSLADDHGRSEHVCQMLATQQFHPGDEIWLVSSRASANRSSDPAKLEWSRLVDGQLKPKQFADFKTSHDSDPCTRTVVYTHGNLTNSNWAINGGLTLYQNVFQNRTNQTPVRYLIWSWRSEREYRLIGKDANMKSRRAVEEGTAMRAMLDQLQGPRPILLGYSFGGQVIVSALQSPTHLSTAEPFYVSLIVPGFNRDFIHCELDRDALQMNTKRMRAFVNEKDRVIWANNKNLCRRKYRGSGMCNYLVSSKLGQPDYLDEVDLTDENSPVHSIDKYSSNPRIIAGILCQLESSAAESAEWIQTQPLNIEAFEGSEALDSFDSIEAPETFESFARAPMLEPIEAYEPGVIYESVQ